jgi:hypothetical protein
MREPVIPLVSCKNALGHWYANIVTINGCPFVLAMSERSLLSVLLPGAPFVSLTERLPGALAQLLRALSVPESQISAELTAMQPIVIAATGNRQLLGCLNQFAFELSAHCESHPNASVLDRELWRSENISSAIGYNVPRDLCVELLATNGRQ